jgi:hypothetical protein
MKNIFVVVLDKDMSSFPHFVSLKYFEHCIGDLVISSLEYYIYHMFLPLLSML